MCVFTLSIRSCTRVSLGTRREYVFCIRHSSVARVGADEFSERTAITGKALCRHSDAMQIPPPGQRSCAANIRRELEPLARVGLASVSLVGNAKEARLNRRASCRFNGHLIAPISALVRKSED